MKTLTLAVVVTCWCLGALPETAGNGLCPFFWTAFKSACYRFISTEVTWNKADDLCASLTPPSGYTTAKLASVHSIDENDFLYNYWVSSRNVIPEDVQYKDNSEIPGVFFGLNDVKTEGTFEYTDGTPNDFNNFEAGEPNDCCDGEDGVHFWERPLAEKTHAGFAKWNDLAVDNWKFPSFCKMKLLDDPQE